MSLINEQIVAMARLKLDSEIKVGSPLSYLFSNGFETGQVPGASAGTGPIYRVLGLNPSPQFLLFLDEPVDAGSRVTGGGLKARADVVGVSTLNAPTPFLPADVEVRLQYSSFNLFGTAYQDVDPRKVLGVSFYLNTPGGFELYSGDAVMDIVVTTDPMVTFPGKISEVK